MQLCPITIRHCLINVRNVPQVSDVRLPGLESLMTITACGSHTLPPPLYFITTAWSALKIITLSFSFVYFTYHAVNFILCSLSDVCWFQHLKPSAALHPLFLVLLCCTPYTFLHFMSGPQVCRSSDTSFLRTAWLLYDLWPPYDSVQDTAFSSVTSRNFHRTQFAVLRKMYLQLFAEKLAMWLKQKLLT